MNRTIITHLLLFCTVLWCCGEPPRFLSLSDPVLKERGPHHRAWERVSSYVTSYGRVVNRTNSFQEIGTASRRIKERAATDKELRQALEAALKWLSK